MIKSVRFLGSYFYDSDSRIVFVPMTPEEADRFKQMVCAAEAKAGRKLTYKELTVLAKFIEYG